jgi:Zn finger protein HypA/HybF involved in hydrogenase expression
MINDLPGEIAFNHRGVEMELECPICDEWIELGSHEVQVTCPKCQNDLVVDADGETFLDENGWHYNNLTKLIAK